VLRINVLGGLYVTADGRAASGAAGQPRRLAVLALLAVAGERGVTRDAFLAHLWPDNDEERGRRALTQALYALRRDLGSEEVFLGLKDLRLNPDLITSDIAEFHEAVRGDVAERAAELYRGTFLQGFVLPGADMFERWVEEQRDALGHEWGEVLESAARRAGARGDFRAAVGYLKKRAGQDPLNAKVAVKLMEALVAQGDIAGALQHARVHEMLVRQELELPPDREVVALADRLRSSAQASPVRSESPSIDQSSPPPAPSPSPPYPAPLDTEDADDVPVRRSAEVEVAQGQIEELLPEEDTPLEPDRSGEILAAIRATSGWAVISEAELPNVAYPTPVASGERRRWLVPLVAGIGVVALATVGSFMFWRGRPPGGAPADLPVVAIGRITDYSAAKGSDLGRPLADMLATNLARGSGFRVVSSTRMLELMRQLGGSADSVGVISAAARQAGARELVDGSLYTLSPTLQRLDLRRVSLATGEVIRAYRIEGKDLFGLADSGTSQLVGDLGGRAPTGSIASVSTTSLVAYQRYEEGLRAYYGGDLAEAERLFRGALQLDSSFAMAQYYLSGTTSDAGEQYIRMRRAVELAPRASDRERLLITANWLASNSSPKLIAVAETLTVRYPEEPEAHLLLGIAHGMAADYLGAVPPFLEVIRLDSLSLREGAIPCVACRAMASLVWAYATIDSLPAIDRVSAQWTRLRPQSAEAWRSRANVLGLLRRPAEADQALRTADSLDPGSSAAIAAHIWVLLHREDYDQIANIAQAGMATGGSARRSDAVWNLAIVFRQEGRLREALALVRDYRRDQQLRADLGLGLLEGQILYEAGRFDEAAAVFDSTARIRVSVEDSSQRARNAAWGLTHVADTRAAQGRSAALATLADTVEALGTVSGLGRDRLLHFHILGLEASLRRDYAGAISAFRRSMYAPVGYTRTNYELAGALLRAGRPREAIYPLQAALRGPYDGTSLYITHPDLHERLAEAFEAVGQPDSARSHYQAVIRAWEKADPQFWARRQSAVRATLRLPASSHS
jgi:DNA-binding SARP family transcriptional activator